mgnify:CR=1 FL=1
MALAVVVTSLLIMSGLITFLLRKNKKESERNFEEIRSWILIPSVLSQSNSSPTQLQSKMLLEKNHNTSLENKVDSDGAPYEHTQAIKDDFEYSSYKNKRNTGGIVYKSVTKRMTLVKVY